MRKLENIVIRLTPFSIMSRNIDEKSIEIWGFQIYNRIYVEYIVFIIKWMCHI